jgi:hypothetical protein
MGGCGLVAKANKPSLGHLYIFVVFIAMTRSTDERYASRWSTCSREGMRLLDA